MKEWKRGGKERIGNNIIGEQVEISFPSVKNRSLFIRVDLSGRMRRGVEIEAIVDDGGRFVKKKKKSCEGMRVRREAAGAAPSTSSRKKKERKGKERKSVPREGG